MGLVTIFSIPKPFIGHIGIIQSNAIKSWVRLPGCQVVLFGEEEGLAEAAVELGVRHVREISRNSHGTPLISEAFEQARLQASTPMLAFVNADIVLTSDFVRAAEKVRDSGLSKFLMVGRRFDVDVPGAISFDADWEARLKDDVHARGVLHGMSGIDYFLFPANLPLNLPPFAVGRPGWDSWLIYYARTIGIPLIDATGAVTAIHQNHPSAYRHSGPEARINTSLAGGYFRMGTLRDANWSLTQNGVRRLPILRRLVGVILFSLPMRLILAIKRAVYSIMKKGGGW